MNSDNSGAGIRYVSSGSVITFPLAFMCSWFVNHSIFWAILHVICGLWYVLYLCMGFGGGFGPVEAGFSALMGE